jgi:prepilin-type N-terminal cleavage/methylation domain-containing protein
MQSQKIKQNNLVKKLKEFFGLPTTNYKLKTSCGFTLIEIMVAVSIFSIVMLVAIGSVLSIVSANRKAQALNSVINNLNFALEGMVRDLRTGYEYDCDANSNGLQDCTTSPGSAISFYSSQYSGNVVYSLSGTSIYKEIIDGANTSTAIALNGEEVKINSLNFYVIGTDKASGAQHDYYQPKIIITVGGEFNGFGDATRFNLQTMVTQRKLDI